MVPPTGIMARRVSRGTEPGAAVRPSAALTCRFHWRLSKVTGAEAIRLPIPAVMA
jgi:hypothetical protein